MQFSITEGFSGEKKSFGAQVTCSSNVEAPLKRRGGQEGFSGAVCLFSSL